MAGPQLGALKPPAGVQNSVLLIVEADSSLLGGAGAALRVVGYSFGSMSGLHPLDVGSIPLPCCDQGKPLQTLANCALQGGKTNPMRTPVHRRGKLL